MSRCSVTQKTLWCALQALEDIWLYENPTEQTVLFYINLSIAILFSVELVMKLIGKGLLAYFTDGWCILDAFVVVVCC